MNDDLRTRKSLLFRLRTQQADGDWEQLYNQYRSIILSFCQKQGLDEFSSQDVLQETMVLLIRKLPEFEYDPTRGRFRNWLLTLVAGKLSDARRRAQRAKLVSLNEIEVEGGFSLSKEETAIQILEKDWMQAMVEEGLRRIRSDPRVKPETFEIFQSCAINGCSVADVARKYSLNENAIYQIKNRMIRRLTREVSVLDKCKS